MRAREGIAVAGTPTSFAAIDLALEPYDRDRVDGHRLVARALRARSSRSSRACRSPSGAQVRGLHPDRAPTIVAGGIILVEAMRLFGLTEIEVSEHDILDGAAARGRRKLPGNTRSRQGIATARMD